jgi:hypothetical protein
MDFFLCRHFARFAILWQDFLILLTSCSEFEDEEIDTYIEHKAEEEQETKTAL